MDTAEHREPHELRGSRTDLGAPGGESPLGNSTLGLRGPLIGGSVNSEELSDSRFHPFWAKAEQLGVLIFIHPQGTAELNTSGRLKGNGPLDPIALEATIRLSATCQTCR